MRQNNLYLFYRQQYNLAPNKLDYIAGNQWFLAQNIGDITA